MIEMRINFFLREKLSKASKKRWEIHLSFIIIHILFVQIKIAMM